MRLCSPISARGTWVETRFRMPENEVGGLEKTAAFKGRSGQRLIGRLNPALVKNAKPSPGRRECLLADGGNLFLAVRRAEAGHITRRWQFQYELNGRRRYMGLGPIHTVGLSEARDKARL